MISVGLEVGPGLVVSARRRHRLGIRCLAQTQALGFCFFDRLSRADLIEWSRSMAFR
jgi:hypothetical protein